MAVSEKSVKRFKKLMEKEYGVKYTYEEAREAAENLYGFFEILYDIYVKEKKKTNTTKTATH
jgi:hypothetical protein